MANNEAFIDYSSCDKEALISMHHKALDLYEHEDDAAKRNKGRFLVLSSVFLIVLGTLIIHTAGCLEDAYTSFLNDDYYSSMELSALFSLILLLIGLICFLNLVKGWELSSKVDSDRVRSRLNFASTIERVLCDKGFMDLPLCFALNEKKKLSSVEEAAVSTQEDKKDKKKNRKEKRKTKGDTTIALIRMFRVVALLFALATIGLFAFLVYSFISRLGF